MARTKIDAQVESLKALTDWTKWITGVNLGAGAGCVTVLVAKDPAGLNKVFLVLGVVCFLLASLLSIFQLYQLSFLPERIPTKNDQKPGGSIHDEFVLKPASVKTVARIQLALICCGAIFVILWVSLANSDSTVQRDEVNNESSLPSINSDSKNKKNSKSKKRSKTKKDSKAKTRAKSNKKSKPKKNPEVNRNPRAENGTLRPLATQHETIANLTDARIMKLAELIEQNAILAGNTQDRLNEDVDNLSKTIQAIGKLQNLVSGERYMVTADNSLIHEFGRFNLSGIPTGNDGSLNKDTEVYGVKPLGLNTNYVLIRWNKGDDEEPDWVTGYILKTKLKPAPVAPGVPEAADSATTHQSPGSQVEDAPKPPRNKKPAPPMGKKDSPKLPKAAKPATTPKTALPEAADGQ